MMLSASASPPMMVKSSLEEMLDSLRQRDESEAEKKPKDAPPALPSRPASRARLPSSRKSVPINFKVVSGGDGGVIVKDDVKRKEKELGCGRVGSFGSKKIRKGKCVECPYVEGGDRGRGSNVGVLSGGSELELVDNVEYFTSKQLRVWCRLLDGRWVSGRIQSSTGEEAVVSLSNGNASPLIVKMSTGELLPANPDLLEGVDDLIQLSYLNEPSVLHNIRYRFLQNKIYSKAGPLLIAVNPFKEIPLYGSDFVTAYRQNLMSSPHVFATAGSAYSQMMKDNRNQSIIISGESGAGKTETARYTMQYLATLGNGSGGMEYGVLHSNYILEAFGNAKTVRNNNSSRFGKLIEIRFNDLGKISGAKIQTFLLEKSRVVQLANGERSYHVFYQLCAGASSTLKDKLNLKMASDYYYLNQSESLDINGVDDAFKFKKLVDSLDILQIRKEDQENVFSTLATVLWLGNISFQVIDNENHVKVLPNEAVTTAGRLMGCSPQELMTVLCTNKIQAGRDSIVKSLTLQQAIDTRDALAKFIYGSLFDWLVEQMNKSLERGKGDPGKSISILDIYGFESFKKNSFEQFCINYANERLQQHFNRHLFKLEQEEYDADGIDWTKVDFVDNEECLNLIEKKPLGILSLLDEESNFPRATDLTFANKLKQHLGSNPCFKGDRGRAFGVRHYAGEVRYDTNGFLEKNRDALHSELIQFLSSCSSRLLQNFASRMLEQSQHQVITSPLGGCDSQKSTVGTKFKGQLFKLMHHLEKTTPHFIRCIKPNSSQLPGTYEEDLVLQQLKCCGVLEVVRISRSGYPTRISHQEFSERYGFLLLQSTVPQDPLSTSIAVLKQFNVLPEMFQVGFTRLYLRTGQIGVLEDKRNQFLQCVIAVQKHFRGYRARCYFFELKDGVTRFQSFVRGENARRKCPIEPTRSDEQKKAVIRLQSVIRGMLTRKQLRKMPNLRRQNYGVMKYQANPDEIVSEVKVIPEEQVQNLPSVVEELQRRILKAETVIGQKEKENAALREQLELSEKRWREYEDKMKTMEDIWQKQMASLQTSLAAARKTLAAENAAGQAGRHDATSPPFYYDSEDAISTISQTPGAWTPIKLPNGILDGVGAGGDTNALNAVNNLVREFEQQKQTFDDDARSLGAKSEQSNIAISPHDELIKLKHRFESWKKEYKFRLRETKARLYKLRNSESERSRRRWWGKISSKAS